MITPAEYLVNIGIAIVSNPIVAQYEVIHSWTNTDDRYIRLRRSLVNGDFVEASEYFIQRREEIEVIDYRYQWMDREKMILRKRWDSTPHHPELDHFPYHVHLQSEETLEAGNSMDIFELLAVLEKEISL